MNGYMPWVTEEWHRRTGLLEMCKGKRDKRCTRRKKEENVKTQQNSLERVAMFHPSSDKLMKCSGLLTHYQDPLSFSNLSLEKVSIRTAVNLVCYSAWGLSSRSEVNTRNAWNILCLRWLCMPGHHYKRKKMKYCSSLEPQLQQIIDHFTYLCFTIFIYKIGMIKISS